MYWNCHVTRFIAPRARCVRPLRPPPPPTHHPLVHEQPLLLAIQVKIVKVHATIIIQRQRQR